MSRRRNGCSGKVRHRTMQHAAIAARKVGNAGLDVYKCPRCHGWHLGTSRKDWKVQARLSQLLAPREPPAPVTPEETPPHGP